MKLELKHLAAYLPYELSFYWEDYQGDQKTPWVLKASSIEFVLANQNKPILRPLSDLTKEIEINEKKFVPKIELEKIGTIPLSISYYYHSQIEKLLKWHFDIYGLIEQGLAIDINTL